MSKIPDVPTPGRDADWRQIRALPWAAAMADCQQDPRHHPEGDVLTHTRMVCEALQTDPVWQRLPAPDREVLWLAALLHDCGKPARTVIAGDGTVSAPGHAKAGAILARRLLWEAGMPAERREAVCALVRWHMRPGFALEQPDPDRVVIGASWAAGCEHLAILARADATGRDGDPGVAVERLWLFEQLTRELGCWDQPFPFPGPGARVGYFHTAGRDPRWAAPDPAGSRVLVMSGLPAAGKDTWLERNHPGLEVVSLDAARRDLGVNASRRGRQGRAVQRCRSRARELLAAHAPFAWNATNVSVQQRARVLGLLRDYDAHIAVVQVEAPAGVLRDRNRLRPGGGVPWERIVRMLRVWDPATLADCHDLAVSDD